MNYKFRCRCGKLIKHEWEGESQGKELFNDGVSQRIEEKVVCPDYKCRKIYNVRMDIHITEFEEKENK